MNVANFIDALRRDDDLDNQQQSGDGARGNHATHFLFLWLSNEGTDYGRLWRRGGHLRLVNNLFVSEEGEVEWTMAMSYYCVCLTTACVTGRLAPPPLTVVVHPPEALTLSPKLQRLYSESVYTYRS